MFKATHHHPSMKNALCDELSRLSFVGVLCGALIGVVFAPGAAAQQTATPSQPVAIDWSVNWNGTTVDANDTIQVNPTPVYVTQDNIFNDGFDTPGMLPNTTDQTATQGNSGYSGLDSAYQPTGSPTGQDGSGIYSGQVNNGTDSGNILNADGSGGGNSQGGPSGNPLTPESYNQGGPPTRPSGTLIQNGSVTQQQTTSGDAGTVPIQTICPY